MNTYNLFKAIKKIHKEAEVIQDYATSFRVFIYRQWDKKMIIALLDRHKEYTIIRISDYPKQKGHYPLCVLEVLRTHKKRKKRTVPTIK